MKNVSLLAQYVGETHGLHKYNPKDERTGKAHIGRLKTRGYEECNLYQLPPIIMNDDSPLALYNLYTRITDTVRQKYMRSFPRPC